jgi:hypothetical protein
MLGADRTCSTLALLLGLATSSFAQVTVLLGPTVTNVVWRYNDLGTELHGTSWETPAYDDTPGHNGWQEGRALLAREDNLQITFLTNTVLNLFLPDSTTARVTSYWFRAHFNFPFDPAALGPALNLRASNHVDDGYVMYLNGAEVDRFNMPEGPVRATTLAVNPPAEPTRLVRNLGNPPGLVQGDNVIAVEVHQAGNNSPDVVWGMVLFAAVEFRPTNCDLALPSDTNLLQCRTLRLAACFNASPAPSLQWHRNGSAIPGATNAVLVMTNVQLDHAGTYHCEATNSFGTARSRGALVQVSEDTRGPILLRAVELADSREVLLSFDEPVDTSEADPLEIAVHARDGSAELPSDQSFRPVVVNETNVIVRTLDARVPGTLYRITLGAAGASIRDACRRENVADHTTLDVEALICLLARDGPTLWRYDESGLDRGTTWREPTYDDTAWPTGLPLFGFEADINFAGAPASLRTPLTLTTNKPTFYFRAHFTLPADPADVTRFFVQQLLDDGAVYYLNGVEVGRSRLPADPVTFNTFAANAPETPDHPIETVDLSPASLRAGDNVLAVEVHQTATSSSDVLFGCDLEATVRKLTEFPALVIRRHQDDGILVSLQAVAGRVYLLESALDLGEPSWQPVQWVVGQGQLAQTLIPISGEATRFIRATTSATLKCSIGRTVRISTGFGTTVTDVQSSDDTIATVVKDNSATGGGFKKTCVASGTVTINYKCLDAARIEWMGTFNVACE